MIPDSVKFSFYIGAVIFFLAVLWTVLKSKEYTPEQLEAFEAAEGKEQFQKVAESDDIIEQKAKKQFRKGTIIFLTGILSTFWLSTQNFSKELYILSIGIAVFGLLAMFAGWMQRGGRTENGFVAIINDFQEMPQTMKQLAVVQFFSWFPLFAMWIYTTAGVTSHIYGTNDTTSQLYNDGADWVAVCFGAYNLIAALVAFGLPVLAKKTSRRMTHLICLVLGGIGLLSIYFIGSPNLLLLPFIGIGIAWASILSMPYAMLAGSIPAAKMGYYMGVFNYFIVIPQLIAATILGFLVSRFFAGEAIYALLIGGFSMIAAGLLCLRVEDND